MYFKIITAIIPVYSHQLFSAILSLKHGLADWSGFWNNHWNKSTTSHKKYRKCKLGMLWS